MKTNSHGTLVTGLLLAWSGITAHAADPVMVLSGDGLTVVVYEYDEEAGQASGELHHGQGKYPFKATINENDEGEVITGQYTAEGQTFRFTARSVGDSHDMIFTTGQKTFHIRPVDKGPAAEQPVDEPPKVVSPLERSTEGDASTADNRNNTKTRPAGADDGSRANPLFPQGRVKMKRHVFQDVTMGMESHAVLLPEGWNSQGRIEWSQGDVPYPQAMIRLISPEKGRYALAAAYQNMYTVMNNVAGFEPIPPQGTPAPENFPQWYTSFVRQAGTVSNIRLLKSQRDPGAEATLTRIQRETNANDAGMRRECWIILFEYDEEGARRREEIRLLYVRYAPIVNQNLSSQMWSVFPTSFVSAPVEKFEQLRPQLYAIGNTLRPTPRWHFASQALLAELSRQRIAAIAERSRQIARDFARLNDAQMAKFRRDMADMDARQKTTVDTIYERQDYRDTDGGLVNLSIHPKHVFSDGQGNYFMTNQYNDKPDGWQEISPVR